MYAVLKLNDKCSDASEPFLSPISIFSWLKGNVNCTPLHKYRVIHQVMGKGFVKFPWLLGCTAAAMLPKQARGTFRKHFTKPFP